MHDELMPAVLPTATILLVLFAVESLSRQRLLFASPASSAFLIYLDPTHRANSIRTLLLAHTLAAGIGTLPHDLWGGGYGAAAMAMVVIVVAMLSLQAVHPPAVATSLAFAFRAAPESNLWLFELSLLIAAVLLLLQRAATWLLARVERRAKTQ